MRNQLKKALLGLTMAGMFLVPVQAAAADDDLSGQSGGNHGCAAKFEAAQRLDMESFRDFDAEAFREGHAHDAVSIFPSGATFVGIDAIMTAQNGHFTNKNAVWSWIEISRWVDGCKTAYIIYDATYDIPSIGFHQVAKTVVTYVYKHGKWLSIMDQGTLLEP